MSTSKVNQAFYLVVLAVTLSCIIIIPFGACEESPSANDTPFFHDGDNSTKNEDYSKGHSSESEPVIGHFLFQSAYYSYYLFGVLLNAILWLLSPVTYLLVKLYNTFVYMPMAYVFKIISILSPLLAFFSAATLFGICVGATAGWFSEVVIGVLTAPSNELALTELENKRRMARLARRAATIADLKARNGRRRIPEEYYRRRGNNPRRNILQNGMLDDYGSDYRRDYTMRGN